MFFIGKDYYSYNEKPYVVKLNPAFNTLVYMFLAFSNLKFGEMGYVTDVIEYILKEFQKEKTIAGKIFSSLFEIGIKRVHFINDNEYASIIRTTVLN